MTNPWIGYADRSYLAIKNAIITKLQNPTYGVTEITDYNDTNPFIKMISIWAGLMEQLGFYVDRKGRESFLLTARLYYSAVLHARESDYRIRGVIPAVGQARFYIDAAVGVNITIPIETEIESNTGVKYLTTSAATILAGQTEVMVDIKQWEKVVPFIWGQTTGLPNMKIPLTFDVVDKTINMVINVVDTYTQVDSWGPVLPTDLNYKAGMNENYVHEIELGDGITGVIAPAAQDIELSYYKSLGTFGVAPSDAITKINTVLSPPPGTTVKVTNPSGTTGASDPEALIELQKNVPLSLRTLFRAVTESDYQYVAELAPGVAKAKPKFDCGFKINLYIVPDGGGIAPPLLLASTGTFVDERQIFGREIDMFSAGEVVIEHYIKIKARPNYFNSIVETDAQNAILDFYNLANQNISGQVNIGNIYQALEELPGVEWSEVTSMTAIPFARPVTVTTPTLNWTKALTANVVNRTFKIIMQTTTTFILLKDNVFMGIFSTGVLVSMAEIEFTVTGSYTAGDVWEFKTYTPGLSIQLDEPSLPVTNLGALNITVFGGL
jgi:hypothetical protein